MNEEKSYVGMGQSLCPVCLKEHDSVVLLNKRLSKTLTGHEFMGWSMCSEHQKLKDDGYVALVVVSNTEQPTLKNAVRTGDLVHVRASAWSKLFNTSVPPKGLAFIDRAAFDKVQSIAKETL